MLAPKRKGLSQISTQNIPGLSTNPLSVDFCADFSSGEEAPPAEEYCTDGFSIDVDAAYPDEQGRNIRDKSDTFAALSLLVRENRKHANRRWTRFWTLIIVWAYI